MKPADALFVAEEIRGGGVTERRLCLVVWGGNWIQNLQDLRQEKRHFNYSYSDYWTMVGSVQRNGASNLLCHHLGRCVAELLRRCAAALGRAAVGGLSQQVGIDGVCQLVVGCGEISGTEGLRAGVVGLLSAPLQRHQQLLQGPEKGKNKKPSMHNSIKWKKKNVLET